MVFQTRTALSTGATRASDHRPERSRCSTAAAQDRDERQDPPPDVRMGLQHYNAKPRQLSEV
jgi:hypothetical protein